MFPSSKIGTGSILCSLLFDPGGNTPPLSSLFAQSCCVTNPWSDPEGADEFGGIDGFLGSATIATDLELGIIPPSRTMGDKLQECG